MGSQIGSLRANAAAGRDYFESGRPRSAGDGQTDPVRFRKEEAAEVRVGFGNGTLSPSGAALRTVNSNLAAARKFVPSVEELREVARQRAAEQAATLEQRASDAARESAQAAQSAEAVPEAVPYRPEPSAQARAFEPEADVGPASDDAREAAAPLPSARFNVLA